MTTPDSTTAPVEIITRKKFIGSAGGLATGAVIGAATYLGSASKAHATGTLPAYLDVVQTFTADQTFGAKIIFKDGQPWVDVRAYGAVGNGTTNDAPAINAAIAAAVSVSSGTSTTGNPIIFFPPGDYLLAATTSPSTTGSILPPVNASNYCLLGAGYQSSRLIWGTSATTSQPMLKLVNPRGVTIKDLGFVVTSTIVPADYGIQIHRAAGLTGANPTEVLVERVFLGGAGTSGIYMTNGIGYTADTGQDTYNDNGIFRDVSIQYAGTGYQFGTANALRHVIECGSVQNCSSAAIDNTPVSGSTGGSYTVMGTRFCGNAITFRIGQTLGTGGESINILGIHAGTSANPENILVNTAGTVTDQSVTFMGGHAILADPGSGYSINFNATAGLLEFHGFLIYSPSGVAWRFPGTAQVNFYGGLTTSNSIKYNGTLQLHGTREYAQPIITPTSGSTTARFLAFGYQNHLAGATALMPTANVSVQTASGSGATATVTGGDVGGSITLNTGSSGLAAGNLLKVTLVTSFLSPPNLIISAGSAMAAAVALSIYSSGNTTTTFYIATRTALTASTQYVWNYVLMG